MIVALSADHPLALTDQMIDIVGIVTEIRFGVILHPHWRIGHVLRGIRTQILAGGRLASARRHAAIEIAMIGRERTEIGEFGTVATHLLRRGRYVANGHYHVAGCEMGGRL